MSEQEALECDQDLTCAAVNTWKIQQIHVMLTRYCTFSNTNHHGQRVQYCRLNTEMVIFPVHQEKTQDLPSLLQLTFIYQEPLEEKCAFPTHLALRLFSPSGKIPMVTQQRVWIFGGRGFSAE